MANDPRFSPTGTETGGRSLSSWLGCGCAAIVTLVMLVVVLVTFFTYRAGQQFGEMAEDPEVAAQAVQEVLPYRELPEGYHPLGAMKVPFLMQVAFLSGPDRPDLSPEAGDVAVEQAFLYIRIRDLFGRGAFTRNWLESGEGDQEAIEQEEIRFDPEEVVDRGELDLQGAQVVWVARRGEVQVDRSRFGAEGRQEGGTETGAADGGEERGGITVRAGESAGGMGETREALLTLMAIRCPEDDWERVGVWFIPDPDPDAPAEAIDWTGTPADPEAIEAFLGHFEICTG